MGKIVQEIYKGAGNLSTLLSPDLHVYPGGIIRKVLLRENTTKMSVLFLTSVVGLGTLIFIWFQ